MAETVTVGCKLPNGLVLRIFQMIETAEPVLGGGVKLVSVAHELPERVTLKGFSHMQNKAPDAQIIGGYALTHGVDKAFWDAWLVQNVKSDLVRNGLIFAHTKPGNTEAESREKAGLKCGLERLDQNALPKGVTLATAA